MKAAIEHKYGAAVTVREVADPYVSGNFEVSHEPAGTLLHSKKAGQGKCESAAEMQALLTKIGALLQ